MKHNNQKGFTLIEVLMASVILVIGMTFVATIIRGVVGKNFHSLRHTQSVILAQNKIEELTIDGYNSPNLDDGFYENPSNPVNEIGEAGGVFTQFWDIEDVNPIEKAKLIRSTVQWEDAKGETQEVLLVSVCIDESN